MPEDEDDGDFATELSDILARLLARRPRMAERPPTHYLGTRRVVDITSPTVTELFGTGSSRTPSPPIRGLPDVDVQPQVQHHPDPRGLP